nr:hypothetical protein [Tanacetum cinerariifolium]
VGGGVAAAAAWLQRLPCSGWWGYGDVDGEVVWCCCRPWMGAKGVVVVSAVVVVVARDSGVRWRVGESGVDEWIDRSEGNNFGFAEKSPPEKFSGGGSMVAGGGWLVAGDGCRILGGERVLLHVCVFILK